MVDIKRSKREHIKQFGVAWSAIPSINHCYQWLPESSGGLVEGDLSLLKVYKEPLRYAEGSPLILHNHFIQLYKALDTLFSEYY